MRSYYVYLLGSLKTPNSKASYIGFSTDPEHRLRQHNNEVGGGARHTSKYRPWHHIAIMSGFPNKIVALMFEWQWQHADRSRITKSKMTLAKSAYSGPQGKLRILFTLLQQPIWAQMQLKVNFQEYTAFEFFKSLIEKGKKNNIGDKGIMQALSSIQYEFVTINDINDMVQEANTTFSKWDSGKDIACSECNKEIDSDNNKLLWYCSKCSQIAHVECTAKKTIEDTPPNTLFPDRFSCHACKAEHSRADLAKTSFHLHEIVKPGSKRTDVPDQKQKKSKSAKKVCLEETSASTSDDGFYSELRPEDFIILDDDQDTRDTAFSIGSKDDGFMAGFSQGTCLQPDIDDKGKDGGGVLSLGIIDENLVVGSTQLDDDDDHEYFED